MYKVITNFTDLQDENYKYQAGDNFPRKGTTVSEERLEELLTDKNRRHKPMIEAVEEAPAKEAEAIEETKPASKKGGRKKADA